MYLELALFDKLPATLSPLSSSVFCVMQNETLVYSDKLPGNKVGDLQQWSLELRAGASFLDSTSFPLGRGPAPARVPEASLIFLGLSQDWTSGIHSSFLTHTSTSHIFLHFKPPSQPSPEINCARGHFSSLNLAPVPPHIVVHLKRPSLSESTRQSN